MAAYSRMISSKFQSTPSARRATNIHLLPKLKCLPISIHALREESDANLLISIIWPFYFNPRPPRGERLYYFQLGPLGWFISIHALREESDSISLLNAAGNVVISIHALREESDVRECFPEKE